MKSVRRYSDMASVPPSAWVFGAANPGYQGSGQDNPGDQGAGRNDWAIAGEKCGCARDGQDNKVEHMCSCSPARKAIERLRLAELMGVDISAERRNLSMVLGWETPSKNDWAKVGAFGPKFGASRRGSGVDIGDDIYCPVDMTANWPEAVTVEDPTGQGRHCVWRVDYRRTFQKVRFQRSSGHYHETYFECVATTYWTATLYCDCEEIATDSGASSDVQPWSPAPGSGHCGTEGDSQMGIAVAGRSEDGKSSAESGGESIRSADVNAAAGGCVNGASSQGNNVASVEGTCISTMSTTHGVIVERLINSNGGCPVRDPDELIEFGGGVVTERQDLAKDVGVDESAFDDDEDVVVFTTIRELLRFVEATGYGWHLIDQGLPGVPVFRVPGGFTAQPVVNGELVGFYQPKLEGGWESEVLTMEQLILASIEAERQMQAAIAALQLMGFYVPSPAEFDAGPAVEAVAVEAVDEVGLLEGIAPVYGTYRLFETGHWGWGLVSAAGDLTIIFGFGAALKGAATGAAAVRTGAAAVRTGATAGRAARAVRVGGVRRFARDVRRLGWDPRSGGAVRASLSRSVLGRGRTLLQNATGWRFEYHHWLLRASARNIPQGLRNAGFNLVPIPRWLNQGLNNLSTRSSVWARGAAVAGEAAVAGTVYTTIRASAAVPVYYNAW
jgi:hypothetical protein